MEKWDDKENRNSNQEEFNHKIGKFLLVSFFIGLAFYLSYILPEFFPNSLEFVKWVCK